MRHAIVPIFTFLIGLFLWSAEASAFCGFYVGKAGCIQDPNATVDETHEPGCASSDFSVADC